MVELRRTMDPHSRDIYFRRNTNDSWARIGMAQWHPDRPPRILWRHEIESTVSVPLTDVQEIASQLESLSRGE